MRTLTIALIGTILLMGIACGQVGRPFQGTVTANRIVIGVEGPDWSDVSIQAKSVSISEGEIRLTGDVTIRVNGRQLAANSATLRIDRITLEGGATAVAP